MGHNERFAATGNKSCTLVLQNGLTHPSSISPQPPSHRPYSLTCDQHQHRQPNSTNFRTVPPFLPFRPQSASSFPHPSLLTNLPNSSRTEEVDMHTMFTSVTRLFRRSASPSRSKSKSRHELTSETHIAYMQAHQRSLQRQQQASSLPLPSRSSMYSFSSLPASLSSPLSPFESLCCELRRVEESMGRQLFAPHGCASEPAFR